MQYPLEMLQITFPFVIIACTTIYNGKVICITPVRIADSLLVHTLDELSILKTRIKKTPRVFFILPAF